MRSASSLVLVSLLALALAGCVTGDTDAPVAGDSDAADPAGALAEGANATFAWATPEDALVRPGASLGGYCTFNWVFTSPNGTAYIGTAGHCTDEIGERVAVGGADPETDAIGTVVFDSDVVVGADALVDFSLIQLDDDRIGATNPSMLGWDGPTGSATASDVGPGDAIAIYGHGMVLGDNEESRARAGILVSADEREYVADMPAVPGDSGAPLIHLDSGKALGIISRFNLDGLPPSTDIGPMMTFIFAELEQAGFDVAIEGP